jgi:hemoglobin
LAAGGVRCGILLAAALLGAACYRGWPPAAARPEATPAAAASPSLYERLGGRDAIRAVVTDFQARVLADARINAFFRGADDERLATLLVEQICEVTGGPCRYGGRSMREAHAGMQVTDPQFDALVEDLAASLRRFGVAEREQTELLTLLGGLRREIVGR